MVRATSCSSDRNSREPKRQPLCFCDSPRSLRGRLDRLRNLPNRKGNIQHRHLERLSLGDSISQRLNEVIVRPADRQEVIQEPNHAPPGLLFAMIHSNSRTLLVNICWCGPALTSGVFDERVSKMPAESSAPLSLVQANVLNEETLIVSFSDGTTAVLSVTQLLALAPKRQKTNQQTSNTST